MKKLLVFMLIAAFVMFNIPVYASTLYDDGEIVIDSTNLYPKTDGGSTLGKSGNEFAGVFTDSITLGGTAKTSWGSVVSPMTDADGYTYPTDSGGDVKLYDDGYISLGGNTAQDCYVVFDSDDDDFYIGRDDTDNDLHIGVGSAVGTDSRIQIDDDVNNTIITIGDGTNAYDHYVIFDGNAVDYSLGYLDTYDMLVGSYGSTPDSNMCFGIENAATPLLVLWNGIDGYGVVDIDYGSGDITDHTFVSDGGTLIIDGTITLTSGEIISNATDDTIRVASNDADTILEIYTPYDTTGDATLKLSADLGDAVKEQWTITNNGDGNDLTFGCDTAVSGTPVTYLTLDEAGILTTENYINITLTDSTTNTATDMLKLTHDTSGTAAAGFGQGISILLEDASGNTAQEAASVDVVWTTATDAGEMADTVFSNITAGTVAENLRIVAASSATTSDYLQFTANTTETNAIVDVMKLKLATGTATTNAGMSISFQPEDATGAEEHATMEIQLTDATRTSCDTDIFFTQDVAGTLETRVLFDADGPTVHLKGTLPYMTIGDAGAEDTKIVFDGNAADYYIGLDDTGGAAEDLFTIGFGSAVGTTPCLTIGSAGEISAVTAWAAGTLTAVGIIDVERAVDLPIMAGTVGSGTAGIPDLPISTSTTPGLETDNTLPALVWADGETSHVKVTFRIPADYASGGAFRAFIDTTNDSGITYLGANYAKNKSGGTWDATPTDITSAMKQAPYGAGAGTPTTVTLTPTAGGWAVSAGDIVTLSLWRDDTGASTSDLELYYVEFYYTATQ